MKMVDLIAFGIGGLLGFIVYVLIVDPYVNRPKRR